MIRLIYVLPRKPSMSRDEFQKYWHEVHVPLVAKHALRPEHGAQHDQRNDRADRERDEN